MSEAVAMGQTLESFPVEELMAPIAEASVSLDAPGDKKYREQADRYVSNEEAAALLRGANSGVRPDLSRLGYRFLKRAFDIVASGAAIVSLAVPALVLCAAIYAKSPGSSPLYGQLRVGRLNADGSYRLFTMWKFRSMVPDADKLLADLQEANEADGPLFKIKDDPRIIPGLGSFIRKHSIDELPQLVNVFLGDMSLIGPRPGLPNEVLQYDDRAKRRLSVKCGCGGTWQVKARSNSTFDAMVDCDMEYIEHSGLFYDIKLIFATVCEVFMGRGAC